MTNKQNDLAQWKIEVAGMDFYDLDLVNQNKGKTYDRFKGHINSYITSLFKGNSNTHSYSDGEKTQFHYVVREVIPTDWWDIATKVASGKTVENNPLPDCVGLNFEGAKDSVYDALLPAYRAIKESYDSRFKLFSWIFDHAKYTAERDSLKALTGLMMSLTGDSKEQIRDRLEAYETNVKLSAETLQGVKDKVIQDRKAYRNPGKHPTYEALKGNSPKKEHPAANNGYDLENDDDDYLYNDDVSVNENDKKIEKLNVNINEEEENVKTSPFHEDNQMDLSESLPIPEDDEEEYRFARYTSI